MLISGGNETTKTQTEGTETVWAGGLMRKVTKFLKKARKKTVTKRGECRSKRSRFTPEPRLSTN